MSIFLPLGIILAATSFFIIASLNSFFIQDDWYHLYQIFDKNPGDIAKTFILWQPTADPLHFYRPLSTKLFFFLMYRLFDLQPLAYLGVNALLFTVNSWLIYRVVRFFVSVKTALWTLFFYSFSLAHFTLFAYHTKVEDLLFAAFTLLTLWLTLKKRLFLSGATFLLALMSRESALVIPVWIAGLWLIWPKTRTDQTKKSFFLTSLIAFGYAILRSFVYGWPQDEEVYVVRFGAHIITNLVKYGQWNLNLTGLISEPTLLGWLTRGAAVILFSLVGWHGITALRPVSNRRLLVWGAFWWLLFLSPVLFFPEHRDPWNLVVSAGGLAFILSITLTRKGVSAIIGATTYLGLFITGLVFYRSQHWVMTRARLVIETQQLVADQCQQGSVTFPKSMAATNQELQYAWYYDYGPRVFCNDRELTVTYPHDQ